MIGTIGLSPRRVWRCALCLLAIAIAIATAPARAGTLYRCEGTGGTVAYQDHPCSAGLHETRAAAFAPEPVRATPAAPRTGASPPRRKPTGKQRRTTRSGAVAALHGIRLESDACRKARAQRDDWERRVGLRRTFEDLRRWQERVDRACR